MTILVPVIAGVQVASARPDTAIRIMPSNTTVTVDETTTFDVVVMDADGGVGSYNFTVGLVNETKAEFVTDIELYGDPEEKTVTWGYGCCDDWENSSVMVEASGLNTTDSGEVVLATVTVHAKEVGESRVNFHVFNLTNEAGVEYAKSWYYGYLVIEPEAVSYEDLGVAPNPATDRETVNVTVAATNGASTSREYTATLAIDGTTVDEQTGTLDAGESRELTFTRPAGSLSPGNHSVSVNGVGPVTLHVDEPAEMVYEPPVVSPNPASVEEPVDVSATVENTGDRSGDYDALLSVDGTVLDNRSGTLAAGETTTVRFRIPAGSLSTGNHSVSVGDSENTTLSVVEPANVTYDGLSLHPQEGTMNTTESVLGELTVENSGGTSAEYRARLLVDGSEVANETATIAAGASASVTLEWSPPEAGTYNLSLVAGSKRATGVVSAVGSDTSTNDTTSPTAVIDAPASATVGESVPFDGSGSTDDTGVDRYAWRFGDGTTAEGPTATHAYRAAGTYTASLTVADAAGNEDTTTLTIGVSEPPSDGDDDSTGGGGGGDSDTGGGSAGGTGGGGGHTSDGGSVGPPSPSVELMESSDAIVVDISDVRDGSTASVDLAATGLTPPDAVVGLDRFDVSFTESAALSMTVSYARSDVPPVNTRVGDLGYVTVEHDEDISAVEAVTFQFRVSRAALERAGLGRDDVALYRYHDGRWRQLDTELVGGAEGYHLYAATSPGLSTFAVSEAGSSPAAFHVSAVERSPGSPTEGQTVTVTATVQNTGDRGGTFDAALTVDGRPVDRTNVTVAAGQHREVSLSATFDEPGDYALGIGDVSAGTVTVAAPPTSEATSSTGTQVRTAATGGTEADRTTAGDETTVEQPLTVLPVVVALVLFSLLLLRRGVD